MFSGTAQVSPSGLSVFFLVRSVFVLVRVTMMDKYKAVVCCLLATSTIMLFASHIDHNVIRKEEKKA